MSNVIFLPAQPVGLDPNDPLTYGSPYHKCDLCWGRVPMVTLSRSETFGLICFNCRTYDGRVTGTDKNGNKI